MLDLVPVCGFIPVDALNSLATELLNDLTPTQGDKSAALRIARGSRHPRGPWQDRPVYSAPVVHTKSPKPPMSRRLPEFLAGRKCPPTSKAIVAGFVHYQLAVSVLGIGKRPALFLAGATFFGRRGLSRPKGVRREYRGRLVRNGYRLTFDEYVAIGRTVLKAAECLGTTSEASGTMATRYLTGVRTGRFRGAIVVHPLCGVTSATGDHPLDHFLPHPSRVPTLPVFPSKIRRASGRICGLAEYPVGLDVTLETEAARRQEAQKVASSRFSVPTRESPSTAWLFS